MRVPPETKARCDELKAQLERAAAPAERMRLLLELGKVLWIHSTEEGKPCLEQALALGRELASHETVAVAANLLAEIKRGAGQVDAAQQMAEQALAASRASGDRRMEAGATNLLGKLHAQRSEFEQAAECFERCRRLSEDSGFLEGVQAALNELGGLHGLRGELHRALDYYRECLRIDDELRDAFCMALHRFNIGWVLEQLGQWEEAAENLYRAIAISETNGYPDVQLDSMNVLGEVFLKRDNPKKAADMFRRVVETERAEPRFRQLLTDALTNLGLALFRTGDLAAAERAYEEAHDLCRDSKEQRQMAVLLWRRAELALAEGEVDKTSAMLDEAEKLAGQLGLKCELAEAARVRALCAFSGDRPDEAKAHFETALGYLSDMRDSYELARLRLEFGKMLVSTGDRAGARELLKEAARVFRELSVVAESEEANRLLFRLQMPAGAEAALFSAIAGLSKIGLEPATFLESALGILCEGLGFDHGVVMIDDRPVVSRGKPDIEDAEVARLRRQPVFGPTTYAVPVGDDGKPLGLLYLAREGDGGAEPGRELLEELARMFERPMRRLAELPAARPAGAEMPGLQFRGIVGRSKKMLANLRVVCRVASASVPVLIRGESGTGKELVARALHESGSRKDKPFVAVNCASVPETLLEAEFFGVEKGAATGVVQRKGRFELANGGTVFLDEVGDMSPGLQARLLRVLQEKTVERLGSDRPVKVDVRVVAATNRDLADMMRQGRFRQDLYYRLNAVELELPPLRERREDIADFVRFFVARSAQEFGRQVTGADDAAMQALVGHDWPGNIRELEHVVERAVILCEEVVLRTCDLPPELQAKHASTPEGTADLRSSVRGAGARASAEVERQLIEDCLSRAEWNVTKAAELAGYSRAQFYRLMGKHDLRKPD